MLAKGVAVTARYVDTEKALYVSYPFVDARRVVFFFGVDARVITFIVDQKD